MQILPADGGVLTAINLKVFQFVKVVDNSTGVIRVVRGETTVFLGATEQLIGQGKTDAVEIDKETAVLVRSKRTGELDLVSAMDKAGPRLFFPQAEESIVEVQKLVKLADYECMSIVNASGELSSYIPLHPFTCPYRLGRALLNRPLHPLTPPYQASSPSSTATTRSEATSQVTHGGPTVPTVGSPREATHRRSGRLRSPAAHEPAVPAWAASRALVGSPHLNSGDSGSTVCTPGDKPRAFFIPPHHSVHTLTWSRRRRIRGCKGM